MLSWSYTSYGQTSGKGENDKESAHSHPSNACLAVDIKVEGVHNGFLKAGPEVRLDSWWTAAFTKTFQFIQFYACGLALAHGAKFKVSLPGWVCSLLNKWKCALSLIFIFLGSLAVPSKLCPWQGCVHCYDEIMVYPYVKNIRTHQLRMEAFTAAWT